MNKMTFFTLFGLIFMISCTKGGVMEQKRGSSGKTLEVLIAADKQVYNDLEPLIDSLFRQSQPCLNQPEPLFDVVNLPLSSVYGTDMFKVHRNIIAIDIKEGNPNKVLMGKDSWSSPQMLCEFSFTSTDSVKEKLVQYFQYIKETIYDNERVRVQKAFKKMENTDITTELKNTFDLSMIFSDEFRMAVLDSNFAWIRKEAKDFSIGVLVYKFPYEDKDIFEIGKILSTRNSVTKQYIPGPSYGSYMRTETKVEPVSKIMRLSGQYAVETRGIWRLEGDFMSGPYVNYMVVAPDGKSIVMIDGFVYSPRKPKRDFLMQAEAICQSIKFNKK